MTTALTPIGIDDKESWYRDEALFEIDLQLMHHQMSYLTEAWGLVGYEADQPDQGSPIHDALLDETYKTPVKAAPKKATAS